MKNLTKVLVGLICAVSLQGCAPLMVAAAYNHVSANNARAADKIQGEATRAAEFDALFANPKNLTCRYDDVDVELGQMDYVENMAKFYVEGGYVVRNDGKTVTVTYKNDIVKASVKGLKNGKVFISKSGAVGLELKGRTLVKFFYVPVDVCREKYIEQGEYYGIQHYTPVTRQVMKSQVYK